MSELVDTQQREIGFRWHLLATASSLAILAGAFGALPAAAGNSGRPTVWIELGGQLERVDGGEQPFAPAFSTVAPRPNFERQSLPSLERAARYSFGGTGKVTFAPEGSGWVFSASVRYGRSNGKRKVHQQTQLVTQFTIFNSAHTATGTNFTDAKVKNSESHAILDFQAGKDIGLGLFGRDGESVVNAGVRFAQFTGQSHSTLRARTNFDFNFQKLYCCTFPLPQHTDYAGFASEHRSFHGIGPSLSWDASARLAGSKDSSEIFLDWGINASVLFGRQKAEGAHHTSAHFYSKYKASLGTGAPLAGYALLYGGDPTHNRAHARSRSVVVPNVGGFAGVSFRYANAKVSMGYQADFFFGAMDGGIDTRQTRDRDFYGPFAKISVGL
jgi:hypothetical protein